MTSMREKMARAYFKVGYSGYGPGDLPDDAYDKVDQDTRDSFLGIADVMLDALMDPTEGMMLESVRHSNLMMLPVEARHRNCFRGAILAAKDGK